MIIPNNGPKIDNKICHYNVKLADQRGVENDNERPRVGNIARESLSARAGISESKNLRLGRRNSPFNTNYWDCQLGDT